MAWLLGITGLIALVAVAVAINYRLERWSDGSPSARWRRAVVVAWKVTGVVAFNGLLIYGATFITKTSSDEASCNITNRGADCE